MAPIKSEIAPWKWVETTKPDAITLEEVYQSYRLKGAGLPRCPFRCVRNCRKNPYCLWGLGEKPWILSGGEENSDEDVNPEFRREDDFVGIINLGTTCYVNALLQLWFHNPILRPAILNWRPSYADDNVKYQPLCLMGQLQAMFARMKISKQSAIDPTTLIESLSLNTGEQQDAQEFAKLFMSVLSTLANEDPVSKELNRAFEGVWKYEMECKVCKTKYSTEEKFTELDLCVKDVKDTSASFAKLFTEEELSGDNQYLCQNCNGKTDAIRRFQLLNLPPVLNVQLLRFIYDKDTRRKKKVTTSYSFPEFLDMSPYVQNSKGSPEDLKYQLTGYLVHNGKSASSGHYVAHILDIRSKSWLIFNDDAVSEQKNSKSDKNGLDESSTLKVYVEKTGEYKSTGAYMLVYTQRSVIESLLPDPEIPAYLKQLIEDEDSAFASECQISKQQRESKVQYFEERKTCVETLYSLLVPEKKSDRPETATDDHKESTNKENSQDAAVSSSKPSSSSKNGVGVGKKGKGKENQEAGRKGTKTKDFKQDSEVALIKAKCYESKYTINDMDFLPYAWFNSWLNQSNEVVLLLTTKDIRCPHNKLALPSGTASVLYKVIPSEVAAILYEKYGEEGGSRLIGTDALCMECVTAECSHQRKVIDLESDHKTMQELLAKTAKTYDIYRKEYETMDYTESFWQDKMWVSKNSIKKWKGWARSSFCPPSDPDVEEITEVAQESNLFNGDIICPHGNLCLDENLRRPVCAQTWSILQKYFPDSFTAHAQSSEPCKQCQADKEKNQSTVLENKKVAEKIKENLSDLIKNRNRPNPYKSSGETYYFVNFGFVNRITSFIKNPDKNEFPCMLKNAELLCESHKKFLYPIGLIEDMKKRHSAILFYDYQKTTLEKWYLATEQEWIFIHETFSVDETVDVNVIENPDDFEPTHIYEPDTCEECSRKWMMEIHNELWQFQGASIYFRPVGTEDSEGIKENGDCDNDDDEDFKVMQPLSKKKKTDEFIRRSGRSRHGKKEKKVPINSDDNVKKLKHYLVKALGCQVFASDISLYYNNQLLDEDNATVSSLGIGPGALIEYKTEIRDENEDSMEVDRFPEPETGFAGTMLQLRLSDESRRVLSTSPNSGVGAGVDSNNSSGSGGANNTQPVSQNSSSLTST